MTKEQRKAIDNLEHIVKHWKPPKKDILATIEYQSIKTALELIKEQQKEIHDLQETIDQLT